MIIINVRVPALEKVYNFSVEERAKIDDLIEEIVELILQKEGVSFSGNIRDLSLYHVENAVQCGREYCLNDYGICGGSELILL